ncbi:Hypothetical predicted protein [Olea europaea subsp. europaea]|uniref:Uncharacterized protein n=1 Tax=Olea europaea subsp. europaea TaxID=158383 RepID=A0A8S0UYJ7_OLEEU|nr:Hypothetical predicted protein [Olea europaea subsp. europaea]
MEVGDGDYEDPDFVHSEVDIALEKDDFLYDRNVTDGIENGYDLNEGRNEGVLISVGEVEDDELEYPSKFMAEIDMANPQFEFGLQFQSMEEFRIAEWYNVELEPVQSASNVAVDEHGKLMSSRCQGLLSTQNEEESMRRNGAPATGLPAAIAFGPCGILGFFNFR